MRLTLALVLVLSSSSLACAIGGLDESSYDSDLPTVDAPLHSPDDSSNPSTDATAPHDARHSHDAAHDTSKDSSSSFDALSDADSVDASVDPSITDSSKKDAPFDAHSDSHVDAALDCAPVINEVQTFGTTAADEFVEIANPCPDAIDLFGWRIAYRSRSNVAPVTTSDFSTVYAFTTSTPLEAGKWFVVGGIDFVGPKDAIESSASSKGMLASTGGQIALRDPSGAIVDGVFYGALPATGKPAFLEGGPTNAPERGASIYRHPDGADTNDNATDFSDAIKTPTPDAPNP